MAVYRLSASMVKRRAGRSAVASAAYRAGTRLVDDRTGTEHDYSRRNRRDADDNLVEPAANAESLIFSPVGAPAWARDRSTLWNAVEAAETRKDAQVARELTVALPVELSYPERRKLASKFVRKAFVDYGMVADVALHGQTTHNPHFHVMLTTRSITADGFGKKNRAWNDRGMVDAWRLEWETQANEALAAAGVEARIDRRSRADRGLAGAPQPKVGPVDTAQERQAAAKAAPDAAPPGGWITAPLAACLAATGAVTARGRRLADALGLPTAREIADRLAAAADVAVATWQRAVATVDRIAAEIQDGLSGPALQPAVPAPAPARTWEAPEPKPDLDPDF